MGEILVRIIAGRVVKGESQVIGSKTLPMSHFPPQTTQTQYNYRWGFLGDKASHAGVFLRIFLYHFSFNNIILLSLCSKIPRFTENVARKFLLPSQWKHHLRWMQPAFVHATTWYLFSSAASQCRRFAMWQWKKDFSIATAACNFRTWALCKYSALYL
jgi:hypothetical protein